MIAAGFFKSAIKASNIYTFLSHFWIFNKRIFAAAFSEMNLKFPVAPWLMMFIDKKPTFQQTQQPLVDYFYSELLYNSLGTECM